MNHTPHVPPPDGWRTFLITWSTQSLSLMGSALNLFAINVWLATSRYPDAAQKPQLAWALAAINLAFAIPTVFAAPVAGAFVDRFDRRRTMLVADLLSCALTGFTVVLMLAGRLELGGLIVLMGLSAMVGSFHYAAFDTSYAMLLPTEGLTRANGMMQTSYGLASVFAPALAAVLVALPALARGAGVPGWLAPLGRVREGAALAIGADSLTFLLAAITLMFLDIPSPRRTHAPGTPRPGLVRDALEGWHYLWDRRAFLWLLGCFAAGNFVWGFVQVSTTLLVKYRLGADLVHRGLSFEAALAMLMTAGGIGGLLGGILISAWGGLRRARVYGVLVPLLLQALLVSAFGLSRRVELSAAIMFTLLFLLPIVNAHSQAIWQAQVPHELQGRVFSVRRLIAQGTWPASAFLAGAFASRFPPGPVVAILGLACGLLYVAALLNPIFRRIEDRDWVEAMAAKRAAARRA